MDKKRTKKKVTCCEYHDNLKGEGIGCGLAGRGIREDSFCCPDCPARGVRVVKRRPKPMAKKKEKKDWLDEKRTFRGIWVSNVKGEKTLIGTTNRQLIKAVLKSLKRLEDEWFKETFGDFHIDAQQSFMKFIKERIKE